ncbi:hypothetical protein ACIBG8_29140 [Nonomuraea sp. NPDC050556]|uniref:ISAzo13-like element transposase-related protein n=1 Tax=Nonomuraea sp. NPDC050556 TaxID=3364369 RepID=UPI0037A5F42F
MDDPFHAQARRLAVSPRAPRSGIDTVGDLLRQEGLSLQGNAKTLEGVRHPDPDARFRYLNEQNQQYQAAGDAAVSVNTKKKELIKGVQECQAGIAAHGSVGRDRHL